MYSVKLKQLVNDDDETNFTSSLLGANFVLYEFVARRDLLSYLLLRNALISCYLNINTSPPHRGIGFHYTLCLVKNAELDQLILLRIPNERSYERYFARK